MFMEAPPPIYRAVNLVNTNLLLVIGPIFCRYSVRLGELNLYRDDDGASPIEVLVEKVVSHEDFSWSTAANDIGVVFLANKVFFTRASSRWL